MNRYITLYRGSADGNNDISEVGIQQKYLPGFDHRWYSGLSYESAMRLESLLKHNPISICEIVFDANSMYITFKLEL